MQDTERMGQIEYREVGYTQRSALRVGQWVPVDVSPQTISKGRTSGLRGRTVEVRERFHGGGPWLEVYVNGKPVEIIGYASRLRDGGTTTIPTTAGTIHLPRKLGHEPGPDTIDGIVYDQSPQRRRP
jgi:hypothetical protein